MNTNANILTLKRAFEVADVTRALTQSGLTESAIARATGASDRTVRNWKRNSTIRRQQTEDRLRQLQELVVLLGETLTPKGVNQWLRARNAALDEERPIELLARGEYARVREAAEAYVEGAYL